MDKQKNIILKNFIIFFAVIMPNIDACAQKTRLF